MGNSRSKNWKKEEVGGRSGKVGFEVDFIDLFTSSLHITIVSNIKARGFWGGSLGILILAYLTLIRTCLIKLTIVQGKPMKWKQGKGKMKDADESHITIIALESGGGSISLSELNIVFVCP